MHIAMNDVRDMAEQAQEGRTRLVDQSPDPVAYQQRIIGKPDQGRAKLERGRRMSAVVSGSDDLVQMSFLVQRIYAEVATNHNLTPAQAQLLLVVLDAPRTMKDVADSLHIDKSSLSGLVDRAGQRGLIERIKVHTDLRSVTIRPTKMGRARAIAFRSEINETLESVKRVIVVQERNFFDPPRHLYDAGSTFRRGSGLGPEVLP